MLKSSLILLFCVACAGSVKEETLANFCPRVATEDVTIYEFPNSDNVPDCDNSVSIKWDKKIVYHIDDKLGWQESIRAAFDSWNKHLGREVFVEGEKSNLAILYGGESAVTGAQTILGLVDGKLSAVVYVYDRYSEPKVNVYKLLMHELGHVLGLVHDTDRSSIMYPILHQGPMEPTKADLAAIR